MKSQKPVYQCRIFRVFEEDVTLPNGHVSRQSWIDHNPCIAVVPVDGDGRLLLIRQYRHATGQMLIEIPAGNMDVPGESVEDCVQRELAEETGYRAGRLIKLFEGYLLPGYCNEYMHYYLALNLVASPLTPDDDEDIETIRVTPEEARKMIQSGQICDSKTALGIIMALDKMK
ncbi:MAG: ADP-ribose pyrophosphatase [Syntrophus sp. SKADARSKE-3]|nr:ADP-ribose pyrophosphatase [Syntrophus sp. SKADARSKE-3]